MVWTSFVPMASFVMFSLSWLRMSQIFRSSVWWHAARRAIVQSVWWHLETEGYLFSHCYAMRSKPKSCLSIRGLGDGFRNSRLRGYVQFGSHSGQTFHIATSSHVSRLIFSINFIKACFMITWSNGVSRWQEKLNWMNDSAACQVILVFGTSRTGSHVGVGHPGRMPTPSIGVWGLT